MRTGLGVALFVAFTILDAGRSRALARSVWCGDLTGDGAITAPDALLTLRLALLGGDGEPIDFNCDGKPTIVDAQVLLRAATQHGVDVFCDPNCAGQTFRFRDVSSAAGLESAKEAWGLSWGDFDSDGWPDLWLGNHTQVSSLYRNDRNGTFTEATLRVAPGLARADRHGAAWADYDNDGDQDLFVAVGSMGLNTPNELFLNEAQQLVDDAAAKRVDMPLARSRGALWFDWNADSRLDLLVLHERRPDGEYPSVLFEQTADGGFRDATQRAGIDVAYTSRAAQLCDVTGDTKPDLVIDGGRFPQRTYDLSSAPFDEVTSSIGLAPRVADVRDVVIADFDNDLDNDIFFLKHVTDSEARMASAGRLEVFFGIRDGEKEHGISFATEADSAALSFTGAYPIILDEIFIGARGLHPSSENFELSRNDASSAGILPHTPGAMRGIFVGFDESGKLHVFVSVPDDEVLRRAFNLVAVSERRITALETFGFTSNKRPIAPKLATFVGGRFVDATKSSGLERPVACVSAAGGDFDNDGDVDLHLVCAGHIRNYPDVLYLNNGQGRFTAVPDAAGAQGASKGLGDSAAVADYDRDGFLDLAVTNGRPLPPFADAGSDQLFRNTGNGNAWIEIDLKGTTSNRDGIGARVELLASGVSQMREVGCDGHLYTQNHRRLHFGLGVATRIDRLRVTWPSGKVQELHDLAPNVLLRVAEPKGR